jgi:hypothetical protein
LVYSFLGTILIVIAVILYVKEFNKIENSSAAVFISYLLIALFLLKFPNWYFKWTTNNNAKDLHLYKFIRKHFDYYYFMLAYLFIIWFTGLKWLDTLITLFFGVYACIVGRRIYVKARGDL